jgi:hypothetical protein
MRYVVRINGSRFVTVEAFDEAEEAAKQLAESAAPRDVITADIALEDAGRGDPTNWRFEGGRLAATRRRGDRIH